MQLLSRVPEQHRGLLYRASPLSCSGSSVFSVLQIRERSHSHLRTKQRLAIPEKHCGSIFQNNKTDYSIKGSCCRSKNRTGSRKGEAEHLG